MNLDLGDERAKDRETLVLAAGRDRLDDIRCGSERTLDARRIPALRRQRLCDGDGISEEGSQALDNETLELGRRNTLPGLMIALPLRPDAGDQPARDIGAIAKTFLDSVRRRHRLAASVEQNTRQ